MKQDLAQSLAFFFFFIFNNVIYFRISLLDSDRSPCALNIDTVLPGGNFRCNDALLQLVQAQNGKITEYTSINWKVQKDKKKCID